MAVHNVNRKLISVVLAAVALCFNAGAQPHPTSMNDGADEGFESGPVHKNAGGRTEISCSIPNGKIEVRYSYTEPVPTDTVRLTILGDMMMHSAQLENCRARYARKNGGAKIYDPSNYDFSPCLGAVRDILQDADICIANMEFTHSGPPFSGYPAFSTPESWSSYIADCGVDVFLMANNHILDGGSRGAERTIGVYENMAERGVKYTGCFASEGDFETAHPLIIECRGIKIAIVNFTYGTNVPPSAEWPKVCRADREEIATAMKKARENADVIIAVPHWGEEYTLRHSQWQEEMAEFMLRNGADAIVGAHPHVVQDIDTKTTPLGKRVPVVYSIGNVISNMSAANTQIGLIVTLPIVSYSDGNTVLGKPEYTFTWCSLPGKLTDCHVTIPVRDWLERRGEWTDPADCDKMQNTYIRILGTSEISDSTED